MRLFAEFPSGSLLIPHHAGWPGTGGWAFSRWLLIALAEEQMTAEPWVSVDDVAKHLTVAKDSIYRWIEHRGLPAHKVGRLWKFKLSDVDAWVRAGGADDAAKAASTLKQKTKRGRA